MRISTSLALAALVVTALGGCGRQDTLDPASVNEAYGGLTTEDEAPLFGEPEVFDTLGAVEADVLAPDAIATDPAFITEEQNAPKVYYLLLAWGKLKRDALEAPADLLSRQDFSGNLSVTDGGIAVIRKMRMERVQGDGLLPRTDRKLIEWQSTIFGGVDGMLVKIVAPDDATLTLTIAGQTIAKLVSELDLAHGLVDVPDTDYAVAWAAAAVRRDGCAHGYLVGRWQRRADIGGVFRGRWVSADGELRGHMRGLFGERRDGDRVFFGKWISGGGEFHGLLAGRYADGALQGHWLDRELQLKGRVKGLFFEPRLFEARQVGFYLGTWQEACASDPIQPSETEVQ